MLGSALKVSINSEVLDLQKTTDYYFPQGVWCKISGNIGSDTPCFNTTGMTKTYPSDLTDYQLHLRDGFIVPMKETSMKQFNTTKDRQQWPVDFHVLGSESEAGSKKWSAQGR